MVIYPIGVVAVDAADTTALGAFLTRPGEWAALWASVWISLVSVILAAAIGIPLAFLFEWFDFPGRKTLGALIALPVVLPPLVGVIAFLFLYGESGFIARAVQSLLHLQSAPWRLQGAVAILLVHAYSMYVYFYLFTRAGLAKLDVSMLEAAQALGADRRATLWRGMVLLLLPHLTLILVSLVPYGAWTTEILPPVMNLENYRRLFSEAERLRPMWNSLWMAAASTAVAVAIALAGGWLVVRRRVAWRRAIEALLALPWALPGTVFAIALAITFSVHASLQLRFVLVGTAVILPLAYLVRALPLTGRGVLAAYRQLDPSLEEAAASLGAGRWRTLARVTLPQLRPGLAAGASLAFVAALGDIVASIVLYTYETRPVSIENLSSLRPSATGVAAAFGVVLMLVSAVVLGVGARR